MINRKKSTVESQDPAKIPDLVKLLSDNGYEVLSAAIGVDKFYGSLNGVVTVNVRRIRK
jgi:hypothetical protein